MCRAGADKQLQMSRSRAGEGQVRRADAEQVQRCRYGDAEVWWCIIGGGAEVLQIRCTSSYAEQAKKFTCKSSEG